MRRFLNCSMSFLIGCVVTIGNVSGGVVYTSGTVTHTFDSGIVGATEVVIDNPVKTSFAPAAINSTINADFDGTASASSAARHIETPSYYAIQFAPSTGVSQNDTSDSNNMTDAATLTVDFTVTWTADAGGFGPPLEGFIRFPTINWTVGSGAGSFAEFHLDAEFTGDETRSDFIRTDTFTSLGTSGSFGFEDVEAMVADGLLFPTQTQTITGTMIFTARGIGSESMISLGAVGGTTSVPEPSTFALLTLGAIGLIGCPRRRRL